MNDLYDQLRDDLDRLVDTEYRDVVRSFLSPEEQTRLLAPVESLNRGDFLGFVKQLKRLDKLEAYFQVRFPDRINRPIPRTAALIPQRLPFTNREDEIKFITYTLAPAYFLVDAPAGYGKSELLKELKRRFTELKWRCAYASVEQANDLSGLVGILANELDIASQLVPDPQLPWGLRLGGTLKRQWGTSPAEGLVLLIDLEKKSPLPIIRELLEQFIPDLQKSLRTLDFFSHHQNRLRVIIAGRHLAVIQNEVKTSLGFAILRLSPFDYDVIRTSVKNCLVDQDDSSVDQLSAHLLYLTGGHPGCMAQVIEKYGQKGIPPDDFIKHFDGEIWKDIVRKVIEEVSDGIPRREMGLHEIIHGLSVFRFVDPAILRRMIQNHNVSKVKNEYDLADELTATYLFERKGRFLRDDITRRLLTIQAWRQSPDVFSKRCNEAQDICVARLREPNIQMPEIWMIEYLFLFLQRHVSIVHDTMQRRAIWDRFMDEEVSRALHMFVTERNIRPEDRREEQNALEQAIQEDWEFRFTINYFLRADQYNDEPVQALHRKVEHFFAQV